jgi:acyl-CoA thioesterase YciA
MKILIEAWRRPREHDASIKVTQAVFTFVAIGDDRRPRPLPEG